MFLTSDYEKPLDIIFMRFLILTSSSMRISDQPYYSHYASALFSLIVFIGTTQLAFFLRKLKFSPFGPNQMIRNSITDFAVVISILIWSLIGNSLDDVPIEKLNVPSVFAPTFQCCKSLFDDLQ